mgnify:CR=1 FL=1
MDKLTLLIKNLNEIYYSMKKNYDSLRKLYKKGSNIHQKILISEEFLGQAYMLIMESMETEEINKMFIEIIKGVKNEKRG